MRSLKKRGKPAILIEKENEWTQELLDFISSGKEVPATVQNRYRHKQIKDELILETHNKCAYCESKIMHIDYGDIEHIQPKSKAHHKTYQWDNLTISCSKCNTNKSNYYDEGSPLLNPYVDIPEEKISFFGAIPFPVNGDTKANLTIKKLKLDRPQLIERRDELIKSLRPLFIQYDQTSEPELKSLILEDILEYAQPNKEFSLMVEHLITYTLAIAV